MTEFTKGTSPKAAKDKSTKEGVPSVIGDKGIENASSYMPLWWLRMFVSNLPSMADLEHVDVVKSSHEKIKSGKENSMVKVDCSIMVRSLQVPHPLGTPKFSHLLMRSLVILRMMLPLFKKAM